MASPQEILEWASAVANEWRALAIAWHLALAVFLIALTRQSQLSHRLLGYLLALPILSVGVVAWASGNPFNGLTFAMLTGVLCFAAARLPSTRATLASRPWMLGGAALIAIGSIYPHFLRTDSWTAHLYASPFGILPCPTLLVVLGVTVLFSGLESRAWSLAVAAASVLYGFIGVFMLQVPLDVGLIAGAGLLGTMVAADLTPPDEARSA